MAENKEIIFSVRSLQKNMLDLGKIFIVGEDPQTLPGCIHIPAEDLHEKKWKNAHHKVREACQIEDLSEEFLLMNDDFILNEPFLATAFPYYALRGVSGGNSGINNFQIHCPIRYKKEFYLQLPIPEDMKGDFSPRSFFSNFFKAPFEYALDCIVKSNPKGPTFDEQIKGKQFFSFSNGTMADQSFVSWLETLFPEKSKFES